MAYEQQLDNGLVLRTARDDKDIQAYVDFNTTYNNPMEGKNSDLLMRHFPGSSLDDYLLVEDRKNGQIVATTCLIPWQLDFAGIPLRAAQLEQVLSHPDYRRHGLVKIQMKRFMQVVAERKLDLSFIWGIPYYYRQYGYSYAIEGNTFESLPSWRIPAAGSQAGAAYTLRPAGMDDVQVLTDLYRQTMRAACLHITRTPEAWRYLLNSARLPVQLVVDARTAEPVGYMGIFEQAPRTAVQVIESGVTGQEAAWAVLHALKAQTDGEIQIAWPKTGTLAQLARGLGSVAVVGGQWLFHITAPAEFLQKIGPVLERRLAASDCSGLTQDLVVNLFRQAYRLNFVSGKLHAVEALGFVDSSMGADGGDLCIPPDAFVRLILGYRGLEQLLDAWPDIVVKAKARHLIDTLFPTAESYLYANYGFWG